jgi:flagellar biosynthetic protein FliP
MSDSALARTDHGESFVPYETDFRSLQGFGRLQRGLPPRAHGAAVVLLGLLVSLAVAGPARAAADSEGPPGPPARPSSSESRTAAANESSTLQANEASQTDPSGPVQLPGGLAGGPKAWTSPAGLSSALQILLLLTVLSLAPAILLMTTCFVRIVVVLGLLRQAIGTQQLPPSQVITAMALFLTLLIMSPVWKQTYDRGIAPYTSRQIGLEEAWREGVAPIRRFMSVQIERTGNSDDVWLFLRYLPDQSAPKSYDDVPLSALLPAFMLSELKTSFLIGFQIYLPFLIVDLVIAGVLVSMGMLMVPPVLISLPFKLMLFVLLNGWHLVVGMLLESFQR